MSDRLIRFILICTEEFSCVVTLRINCLKSILILPKLPNDESLLLLIVNREVSGMFPVCSVGGESIYRFLISFSNDARHFVENVFCRKCCNFKNIHRKILRFIP